MEDFFQFLVKHQFVFAFLLFLETFLLVIFGGTLWRLKQKALKLERKEKEMKDELTREVNFCLVPLGKKGIFIAQIEMIVQGGELKKIKVIPQTTIFADTADTKE